jgi:HEAT repeat protein
LASPSDEADQRIAALADEHVETRREAAAWLLDHPDAGVPRLRELVEAGRPDQQTTWAVDILGRLGDERDVPLLARLLETLRPGPYWEAAQGLAKHAAPAALEALRRALESDDPEVVGAAAVALGVRGDEAARPDLEARLRHSDESVRYRAVYALQQLGSGPSAEALAEAARNEPSRDVRGLIDDVLGDTR